jgi:hypothetical protein
MNNHSKIGLKVFLLLILSLLNGQSSLEKQLKEINDLRAKLDGLKIENKSNIPSNNIEDEIWSTITSTWESELAGEDWVSKYCLKEVLAWNNDSPLPHDKTSLIRNRVYESKNTKMLFYDIQKAGITIKDNLAVVHYYFTVESLNVGGKIEKNKGKLTDVLLKENNKWKYLAWAENKTSQPAK